MPAYSKLVKTDVAKSRIIKYLSRVYEGENPKFEATVNDKVFDTALDSILCLPDLKDIMSKNERCFR